VYLFPRFFKNIGFVRTVGDGIVTMVGLDLVKYGEMILFSNRGIGVVLSLEKMTISAIVLGSDTQIFPGDFVFRTATLMGIFVSSSLLGTVVNPLGRYLSKKRYTTTDHTKFPKGKYMEFKDLFAIFYLDPVSFKELILRETADAKFFLSEKSLIRKRYMISFTADYAKFLKIRKTFSIFKSVKEFFKSQDLFFIKTLYRSKKLLSNIYDIKVSENFSE
jgi:F0F1-type ATP synthase beta subunit